MKPCNHRSRVTITRLLIESHVGLVQAIASTFTYHDPPELLSEGLLILTGCVRNYKHLNDNNISAYINKSVRRGIMRFVRRNLTQIKVPLQAFQQGHSIHTRNSVPEAVIDSRTKNLLPIEVRDIVATVVKCDKEKTIAACLLGGGYTCQDMADILGISSSRAQVLKARVEQRIAIAWNC